MLFLSFEYVSFICEMARLLSFSNCWNFFLVLHYIQLQPYLENFICFKLFRNTTSMFNTDTAELATVAYLLTSVSNFKIFYLDIFHRSLQ